MKRGQLFGCGLAACVLILVGGCAVSPSSTKTELKAPVAERDVLADAAKVAGKTPWPKPEPIALIARVTGGGGKDRVSQADAVDFYIDQLNGAGAGFARLEADAQINLAAANRLNQIALAAIDAPRLSMNDVVIIENAIQALREQRQIYAAAAKELVKAGAVIDEDKLDLIRDDYRAIVKRLGKTADHLAHKIDDNHWSTYAKPERKNFSDL